MSIAPISRLATSALTGSMGRVGASSGSGFGAMIQNQLETVSNQQANADRLAEQAAVGELKDPHEYMIAATEASLSTELTVAVRNKAVEAFNDVMRMNV